jgi:pheromone shutdown-related protein TraB
VTDTIAPQENVDVLELADKTVYLVGTAHISRTSAELAEETIRRVRPETVAVELCAGRYQSLQDPDRWKNTDILKVIKEGRAYVLMAQLILAGFQKKLGKHLQVKPGEEMMRALTAAKEIQAEMVLADRDVKITLKRTWAALGLWSMCKVLFAMMTGLLTSEKLEESDVERLKSADALQELMKDFSAALPTVQKALIEERDQYLAEKIRTAPGKTVVAVLGAGHVPGIKRWIRQKVDLSALEQIPPPGKAGRIIGWAIPMLLVGLVVHGVYYAGVERGIQMIQTWTIVTATCGALGALISLAHPLTILSAFVASPFTTANPLIAAGWVAGLVEAAIRKPRVADLETIGDDISTVRGIWTNRVSKILLVICATNITASLGTFLALYLLS